MVDAPDPTGLLACNDLVHAVLAGSFASVESRDPRDRMGEVYSPIEHFFELANDVEVDLEAAEVEPPRVDDAHPAEVTSQILVEVVHDAEPVIVTTFADGMVEVAEFALVWNSHVPEAHRSGAHRSFLPVSFRDDDHLHEPTWRAFRGAVVANMVRLAHASRQGRHITCTYCARRVAPEHAGGGTCHGCMERHHGVTF